MSKYEYTVIQMMENAIRTVKAQPLFLGGVSGSGGGAGGPPGGFIGKLPQRKVAYDTTEAETNFTPVSGTLLDNLNHIRYRIRSLENNPPSPLSVYDDGSLVASGITILDFYTNLSVINLGGGHVKINSTGTSASGSVSHIYNEDLTSQVPGTAFTTVNVYASGTLRVHYNGVRQRSIYFTEGNQSFTLLFDTYSGDSIMVDYDIQASGSLGWGEFGWGG